MRRDEQSTDYNQLILSLTDPPSFIVKLSIYVAAYV